MTDLLGTLHGATPEAQSGAASQRTFDQEREYLEGLLTSRFNFYFVFAGAIAAGATQLSDPLEQGVLFIVSSVVSGLFWCALYRNYLVVAAIIAEIDKIEGHPLQMARAAVGSSKEEWTRSKKVLLFLRRLIQTGGQKPIEERPHVIRLRQANYYIGLLIPGSITVSLFILGAARIVQTLLPDGAV